MDNTNNALAVVEQRGPQPIQLATERADLPDYNTMLAYAQQFAQSGYFADARQAAQALVKIEYGRELGIPAVAAMLGVHFFEGKPTLAAPTMAALVRKSRVYDYRIIESDDAHCKLEFFRLDRPSQKWLSLGFSEYSTENARAANLLGKANWKGYPKAMCYHRAMSQGVKMHCPEVTLGPSYTPEELGAETDSEGMPLKFEVLPPAIPEVQAATAPPVPLATDAQLQAIENHISDLGYDRASLLTKLKVSELWKLTQERATNVIARFEEIKREQDVAQADASTGELPPEPGTPAAKKGKGAKSDTPTEPATRPAISSDELFGDEAMPNLDAGMPVAAGSES